MNRTILTFFGSLLLITAPLFAFAQDNASDRALDGLNETAGQANITTNPDAGSPGVLAEMWGTSINYLFGSVAIIFVTFILIGGYLWMSASGDPTAIAKAKKFILNSLFGLIVIFVVYALVFTVLGALSGATGNGGS